MILENVLLSILFILLMTEDSYKRVHAAIVNEALLPRLVELLDYSATTGVDVSGEGRVLRDVRLNICCF